MFGGPDLKRTRLGDEPWTVMVCPGHRLAGHGPVGADELDGEQIVVTGHRDGAGYDRAVAELLESLGVTAVLVRGGPGPALLRLSPRAGAGARSESSAAAADMSARVVEPGRSMGFDLFWRETRGRRRSTS